MEKLLIMCYRAPYPLRSGSEIRMYQFIEVLSKKYSVDVVYLSEHKKNDDMDHLKSMVNDIKGFYVGKAKRILQACLGYCFHGLPLQIGYFYSKPLQQWVNRHLQEYEKVLCMHIRTFSYIDKIQDQLLEDTEIYLDGIDAISLNYHNTYLASKGFKRMIYKLEAERLKGYEKKAYETVQHASLISRRDKEYLNLQLGVADNASIIYNYAIDLGYSANVEREKRTISFMGKMNYAPNVDAILHFIRYVYPDVRKDYPDLEFRIIGGYATKELLQYDGKMGIRFLGFVDEPAEDLQKSTLVIAPMISGSGLQNKILQAMLLECPVITTRIGADGMEKVGNDDIIIADGDDDMIKKTKEYLSDQMADRRDILGKNARNYVLKYYSYDAIENQIMKWME